jgi:hypothetical protein
MNALGMYKVTYQAGKGLVEIIQVSKKVNDSWELLRDSELVQQLEDKILKNPLPQKSSNKMGYGEAVYNENLRYITGSFEVVD